MNSDDKFEILNEIDSWEKEIKRLQNSEEEEADEILEIEERIDDLYAALRECREMKELEQKYIDILEENGWSVSVYIADGRVELEKYSPAGEDFVIAVEMENFPSSVREYANDFDADEHAEMWIKARGKIKGIPESVRDLIDDADAIQEMLNKLADALEVVE